MILTITFNPSMDYSYIVKELTLGKVNRVDNPHVSIGGKGINAGRVAAISGSDVILTGVLGGENGQTILKTLIEENRYQLEFLKIPGNSRNAITIMHDNNTHTEIVEKGIYISKKIESEFYEYLTNLIANNPIDVICISGSANSNNENFYCDLINFLRLNLSDDFPILMDISGKQLINILKNHKCKPTFIKPNTHELSEILNDVFETSEAIIDALRQNLFNGIELVMVSRGSKGAIVKYQDHIYEVIIPKIKTINTTGSGDATVGGMAYALGQGYSAVDSIKYSMACGMSNAKIETNGIIDPSTVNSLLNQIVVKKV